MTQPITILVLNAPFYPKFSRPQRSPAVTKSGTLYYPIWLAYATGVLEAEGHTVALVDAPARKLSLQDVVDRAVALKPKLVVIDTSTPSIKADVAAAEAIKSACREALVTLVGTHASALPEETLGMSPAVDAVVVGEYDYTVRDLARAVVAGRLLDGIEGVVYRGTGGICHTPRRELIADLDSLPFVSRVYRRHLDPRDYFNPNARYPNVTILTGRGCPYQCSFCVYPQTLTGNRYRVRSIANVLAEVQYVIEEFPEMKEIFFEDDTLTGHRARCRELCLSIIDRGIRFGWVANARADLDYETMRLMRRAGCREVCAGFESGNQAMLDGMSKNMTVQAERQFMSDAHRAGLLVHGCFMVGFPGETRETMERTLAMAMDLSPDSAQFYPVMVYPGTKAYETFKAKGWLTTDDFDNWLTSDGLHNCVTRTAELSPPDMVRFCDEARRRFYLRPRYWAYKSAQVLRHPAEFGRTARAARTFMKYLWRGSLRHV